MPGSVVNIALWWRGIGAMGRLGWAVFGSTFGLLPLPISGEKDIPPCIYLPPSISGLSRGDMLLITDALTRWALTLMHLGE